jgi:hypothetical protein
MVASKALSQKDMGSNKIINMADGTAAQDAATKAMVDAALATAISRANHTGTQLASTISNFDTQVRTTRAGNWDTSAEAVLGSYWLVLQGTKADSFALLTNDTTITLGTTVPAFTFISVAGASIGRFSATCPAAVAGATWTVTHNLNSQDVDVTVRRTASPYDIVDVYIANSTVNTVSIIPDVAVALNEFTAIVKY